MELERTAKTLHVNFQYLKTARLVVTKELVKLIRKGNKNVVDLVPYTYSLYGGSPSIYYEMRFLFAYSVVLYLSCSIVSDTQMIMGVQDQDQDQDQDRTNSGNEVHDPI